MEQSQPQSSSSRLFKTFRFIGIYVLSVLIFYLLGGKGLGIITGANVNPLLLLICGLIVFPLTWALSKNFFIGFIKYAILLVLLVFVDKGLKNSHNSDLSSDSPNASSSYVGNYSADENGVQVKIVVSPNKWYGEVIEGTTGRLISNEGGDVSNNSLYDQYGNEIGEIGDNQIKMSIQGQRIRLTKN
ncbi:MAG: hypothetical protein U0U46_12090 [Saprospiraceae bacterium]